MVGIEDDIRLDARVFVGKNLEASCKQVEALLREEELRSGSPYRSPWRLKGIEANTTPFDAYPVDR